MRDGCFKFSTRKNKCHYNALSSIRDFFCDGWRSSSFKIILSDRIRKFVEKTTFPSNFIQFMLSTLVLCEGLKLLEHDTNTTSGSATLILSPCKLLFVILFMAGDLDFHQNKGIHLTL